VDDVRVAETGVISVFIESGGQVAIEAEHFSQPITLPHHLWLSQTILSGYTGSGYLTASPDVDLRFGESYTTTSPALAVTFQVNLTGTYYLWLRGYAPNAAGDSLYVGLDGPPLSGDNRLTGFAPGAWSWDNKTMSGGRVVLEIDEPGLHTLYLWMREDGLRLDRALLTSDKTYIPVGNGPTESDTRRVGVEP